MGKHCVFIVTGLNIKRGDKMKKETYFFSHDCNARNDERILMLRADHGMEGYGIYWALIEMMFETSETCLSHDKIKGIAVSYSIPISKLQDTIDTCIKEGLFISDGNVFWSESLIRRKEKYHSMIKRKSEGGKKAMEKRWNKESNANVSNNIVITNLNDTYNEVITSDNKGNEIKEKKKKEKNVFIPPTLEEIQDYINEMGYIINAKDFYVYYNNLEWKNKDGKQVVNWKNTTMTWNNRELKSNPQQKKQSNGIAPLEVEITAEYYDPFAR